MLPINGYQTIIYNKLKETEYKNEIDEVKDSIEELKRELIEVVEQAQLEELNNSITLLNNEFERLDVLQNLNGQNTLELLNQQLNVIEKQKSATQDLIDFRQDQVNNLSQELFLNCGIQVLFYN